MAYIISFLKFAECSTEELIIYCKKRYNGGDLKAVHNFLLEIGNKINITHAKLSEIHEAIFLNYHHLKDKSWFNIVVKIMCFSKQLLKNTSNFMIASPSRWDEILSILI